MRKIKMALWAAVAGVALFSGYTASRVIGADEPGGVAGDKAPGAPVTLPPVIAEAAKNLKEADLVPLKVELPKPLFTGTPKAPPKDTTVDLKSLGKRRGDSRHPKDVELVSMKKKVTMSDANPIIGDSSVINDGSKEGTDGNWVELGPGLQWVQIDLGAATEVWAVTLWHFHAEPRIYRDVVVQVANDPDFIDNVRTIYNNDQDNSAGLGLGKDNEYFESDEGKLVDGKGEKARYVRCYSKGNTSDAQNHYIEVEVYGRPAK